jgi:hypothetical protein
VDKCEQARAVSNARRLGELKAQSEEDEDPHIWWSYHDKWLTLLHSVRGWPIVEDVEWAHHQGYYDWC